MKTLPLYSDVVLLRNLPQHSISAGDIGTVVSMHKELQAIGDRWISSQSSAVLSLPSAVISVENN
jgi:Domain of unknown function (DUF4926)